MASRTMIERIKLLRNRIIREDAQNILRTPYRVKPGVLTAKRRYRWRGGLLPGHAVADNRSLLMPLTKHGESSMQSSYLGKRPLLTPG